MKSEDIATLLFAGVAILLLYAAIFVAVYLWPLVIAYIAYLVWLKHPYFQETRMQTLHDELYRKATDNYSQPVLSVYLKKEFSWMSDYDFKSFVAVGNELMEFEGVPDEIPKPPIVANGMEGAKYRDLITSLDTTPNTIFEIGRVLGVASLALPDHPTDLKVDLELMHNEDCCVHFPDDSRACDCEIGSMECCDNMRFIKRELHTAETRGEERIKPRKYSTLELVSDWIRKFHKDTKLVVKYSDTSFVITNVKGWSCGKCDQDKDSLVDKGAEPIPKHSRRCEKRLPT